MDATKHEASLESVERRLERLRIRTRIMGFAVLGVFCALVAVFVYDIHVHNQIRKDAPGAVGFPNQVSVWRPKALALESIPDAG